MSVCFSRRRDARAALLGHGTSRLSIPRSKSDRHRVDWLAGTTAADITLNALRIQRIFRPGSGGDCLELHAPVATGGQGNFKVIDDFPLHPGNTRNPIPYFTLRVRVFASRSC